VPHHLPPAHVDKVSISARFAREHNLVRSVGRTAVCWDNNHAESLWTTLQFEFAEATNHRYHAATRRAGAVEVDRHNFEKRHSFSRPWPTDVVQYLSEFRTSCFSAGMDTHGSFQFGQTLLSQRYQCVDIGHRVGPRGVTESDPVGVRARRHVERLTVIDR